MRIRQPRQGEGVAFMRIAALALREDLTEEQAAQQELAIGLDKHGGQLRTPHGSALVLVAATLTGDRPCAAVYVCPPERLISECTQLPERQRKVMGILLAEIELLAVLPGARTQGVGTELLKAVEQQLRERGCRIVYAQVHADDTPVIRWYRKRGYKIVPRGTYIRLATSSKGPVLIQSGAEGRNYLIAIKRLDGPVPDVSYLPIQ